MDPTTLYIMCALGAAAMFLVMRPGRRAVKLIGGVIGLAAVAWFLVESINVLAPETREKPEFFYTVFTVIALASAVRMITHPRPVYCALYFVLVVLASAALFLLLAAEFMAFALIIVYAGAILVTYMFVLMLAQQSPDPDDPEGAAPYDRIPREPAAACVVGFLLLAVLGNMIYFGPQDAPQPPSSHAAALAQIVELNDMPRELEAVVEELSAGAHIQWDEDGRAVSIIGDAAYVRVIKDGDTLPSMIELSHEHAPGNIQLVGLALVAKFPVSLELAGIILLLAMFGAVVLARRQIELSEDELRAAAGYRRLTEEGDEDAEQVRGGGR
jgi:NADH-quinone oxidoreductase subunit J